MLSCFRSITKTINAVAHADRFGLNDGLNLRSRLRLKMGNGRNTVSRVLFQKRELTEFCGKLGEFCEKTR